jgi:protein SCO1/2
MGQMMKPKNSIWLFVGLVIVVPVIVFGLVSWYERNYETLPVFVGADHRIGNFEMKNQHGDAVTLEHWKGKIVVANFFFTHCPVVCPRMTRNLKTVQENFAGDNDVLIQSFTVDPDRDSVDRLAAYAVQFQLRNENWDLLTGPKKEIYRLARKSFLVSATDGDGGENDFIHSDRLVLVDSEKRIRGYYDGTNENEVAQLINDIRKLKKEH